MNRLYRKLAATFLVSALLFVLVFAAGLYLRGKAENGRYLDQILENVELNLEKASEEYTEMLRRLEEDYISCARASAYIIEQEGDVPDADGLRLLKELVSAGDISLIDPSGTIFASTRGDLVGSREEEAVLAEIEGGREEGQAAPAASRYDRPGFLNRPEYFYTVAAVDSGRAAAVRIDADLSGLSLKSGRELVESTLGRSTTERRTVLFAVGKQSGRIFGIAGSAEETLQIEDLGQGEELLSFLSGLPEEEPVTLRVNGAHKNAVIRDMGELYLMAYSGLDRIFGDILLTFWIGLVLIGCISIFTILTVRHHLKKYLFRHFEDVREEILGVLSGGAGSRGGADEIPELKPFMDMITRLEQEYADKALGMDRMEIRLTEARAEAEYDRLTGLYNRRGFERRVRAFLQREKVSGALVLLDLDHFKRINDSEGHPEGDRVLREFARCLTGVFRKEDITGRLGGDEFIVLIENAVPPEVLEVKFGALLGEIRQRFREYYGKYRMSASIGAVPVDGEIRDYETLYRCADTALYIAKNLGKNRFYINEKKISCMKQACIGCREECPRSRLLSAGGPKRAEDPDGSK